MFLFNQIGLTSSGVEQAVMIQNVLAQAPASDAVPSVTVLRKIKKATDDTQKATSDNLKNGSESTIGINVEKRVKSYFSSTPILANIARCESTYRQFDIAGDILRGKVNKKDVGVMQINEGYHASRAKELGLDLHTLDGNLAYAKILYKEQGTSPWLSSEACWGGVVAIAK